MSRTSSRVTLEQVAAAVGLGRTTVSDILHRENGEKYASVTRARVAAAVADLGYVPVRAAQQMARGKSGAVGLLLTRDFSNPYFARVADRVERELRGRGYRLQIAVTDGDADTELLRIRQFHADAIEGLIVGPVYEALDLEQHRQIFRGRLPTVLFGTRLGSEFDEVATDDEAGRRLAVNHLVGVGHRRIGLLCVPASRVAPSDRTSAAMIRALASRATVLPEWVAWHADTGSFADYHAVAADFAARWKAAPAAERPTAVICHNDQSALATLAAFAEAGVAVPADVSVVGHDNLPESRYLVPPLTTVDNHVERQMRAAVDGLLWRIEHPDAPLRVTVIDPELVERGSARPRGG